MKRLSYEDVCCLVNIIKKLEDEDAFALLSIILALYENQESK